MQTPNPATGYQGEITKNPDNTLMHTKVYSIAPRCLVGAQSTKSNLRITKWYSEVGPASCSGKDTSDQKGKVDGFVLYAHVFSAWEGCLHVRGDIHNENEKGKGPPGTRGVFMSISVKFGCGGL